MPYRGALARPSNQGLRQRAGTITLLPSMAGKCDASIKIFQSDIYQGNGNARYTRIIIYFQITTTLKTGHFWQSDNLDIGYADLEQRHSQTDELKKSF